MRSFFGSYFPTSEQVMQDFLAWVIFFKANDFQKPLLVSEFWIYFTRKVKRKVVRKHSFAFFIPFRFTMVLTKSSYGHKTWLRKQSRSIRLEFILRNSTWLTFECVDWTGLVPSTLTLKYQALANKYCRLIDWYLRHAGSVYFTIGWYWVYSTWNSVSAKNSYGVLQSWRFPILSTNYPMSLSPPPDSKLP